MAILQEVIYDVPSDKVQQVIAYYQSLYTGKENATEPMFREFTQVTLSLLSGHVPTVLEHVSDFLPGLLQLLPELKGRLSLIPERTNEFIGWFSYNPNQSLFPDNLARSLNDAIGDYSGPIHAVDVFSSTHNEVGIVFTSLPIEQANADGYFEDMLAQVYMEDDEDDEFDSD